jgi:3-phenylpropionate/trans-cinnamate dioxygenase ferredoxin subunit
VSSAVAAPAEASSDTLPGVRRGPRARTRHVVARAAEIAPGERKIALAGRVSVGLFNVDGAYYALANACPHMGAPLCAGQLTGTTLPSAPATYEWGEEGHVLRCPWHKWEFDVRTGESLFDPAVRTRSYRAAVEDGDVVVYV